MRRGPRYTLVFSPFLTSDDEPRLSVYFKQKRKGIRVSTLTALGTLSFFACWRDTPPFASKIPPWTMFTLRRRGSAVPRHCLLEPRFPLFLRERKQGSALSVARKNSPLLCSARLRERQSPLSRIRLPKARFWRALLHYFITSQGF